MPRTVLNSSSLGTWIAKASIRVIIYDNGVQGLEPRARLTVG